MYKKTYKIAGHFIEINSIYEYVHKMCGGYECREAGEFSVDIAEEDIKLERKMSDSAEDEKNFPDFYLESLAVYRKICEKLIYDDIILCHGSAVSVDGNAYLFTAKSGTGKSTHTRLWREYFGDKAIMVNDDKPLLKVKSDGVTVYGTPWNGKHHLGSDISVRLKAVCILERAAENRIEEITLRQAYPMLVQQIYHFKSAEKAAITLKLIDLLGKNMNFYRLGCNMSAEAVKVSYNGMKG